MPKYYNEVGKRATAKYIAKAYDDVKVRVPKGWKNRVLDHYAEQGLSVNSAINAFLRSELGVSEEEWVALTSEAEDQN